MPETTPKYQANPPKHAKQQKSLNSTSYTNPKAVAQTHKVPNQLTTNPNQVTHYLNHQTTKQITNTQTKSKTNQKRNKP